MNKERIIDILTKLTSILIVAYISLFKVLSISQSVNIMSLVFMFLICLLTFLKKERFVFPKPIVFLIGFCVFSLLSLLWNPDPRSGYRVCFRTIPLLTVLAILVYNFIYQNKNPQIILYSIYGIGVVLTVAMIIAYDGLCNLFSLMRAGTRLGGLVNNENDVGMGLAMAAVVSFYYTIHRRKFWNVIPFVVFTVMTMAAGSRTSLVILVPGVFLLVLAMLDFSKGHSKKNVLIVAIAVALIVAFFLLMYTVPAFINFKVRFESMLTSLTGNGNKDGSTNIRKEMIEVGWQTFKNHPLFGMGMGSSSLLGGWNSYLHNNYIELLSSVGIVGFVLYYAAYLIPLWMSLPGIKKHEGLAIIAIVVNLCWFAAQMGTVSYETKDSYYYLVLLVYVSEDIMKKQKADTEQCV